MPQSFIPGYLDGSSMMAPIRPYAARLPLDRWPTQDEMQRLAYDDPRRFRSGHKA